MNSRFLRSYNTVDIEYTFPVNNDQLCMVVPKSLKIPLWKTFVHFYSNSSWYSILTSYFMCTIFWYYLNQQKTFKTTVWQCISYLTGIPIKIKPSINQHAFLISCLFFNIIIFGIIQGSLFTEFTTVRFFKDIDTLEELYQSNLKIVTDYWYLVAEDNSTIMQKLKTRLLENNEDPMDLAAYKRKFATLGRKKEIEFSILTKYTKEDGVPLLHILNECHGSLLLVYIVPKYSPFLDAFNKIIIRFFESGFFAKWYEDILHGFVIEVVKAQKYKEIHPISLNDVQVAFFVLFFGWILSSLIFFTEVGINKCFNFFYLTEIISQTNNKKDAE